MTADLVTGGLGGDGPIVTAGLGTSSPADPNAMRAVLAGSGSLTATLTATGTTGGGGVVWSRPANVAGQYAAIYATLHGSSTLTAHLIGIDRDAEAVLLLLDLELTITEGATL